MYILVWNPEAIPQETCLLLDHLRISEVLMRLWNLNSPTVTKNSLKRWALGFSKVEAPYAAGTKMGRSLGKQGQSYVSKPRAANGSGSENSTSSWPNLQLHPTPPGEQHVMPTSATKINKAWLVTTEELISYSFKCRNEVQISEI